VTLDKQGPLDLLASLVFQAVPDFQDQREELVLLVYQVCLAVRASQEQLVQVEQPVVAETRDPQVLLDLRVAQDRLDSPERRERLVPWGQLELLAELALPERLELQAFRERGVQVVQLAVAVLRALLA